MPAPPANTLRDIRVEPHQADLTAGSNRQFQALGTFADGHTAPLGVSWRVTGGTITSQGVYTAAATPGTYLVIGEVGGGLADTAFITVLPPPAPPTVVTGYNPARLGSELVVGDSWQSLGFGSDNGYSSVKANNWGGQVGQITLEADPVFGKVIKWAQPNYLTEPTWPSTLQYRVTFPPVSRFWYRAVVRLDGNGNPKGFTSYGTGQSGGSTTWKMLFVFPVGAQNRMEFELLNGGDLFLTAGQHGDNVTVETSLPQGGAQVPPIAGSRISVSKTSTGVASDLLQSKEWFELVINFEQLGPARYIQRYFARQLTTGGGSVWAPQAYPTWKGWQHDVTSGAIVPYNLIHLGGNKSQTNDGPNHQFVRWGPWEVTTAQDPYGWDRYGK